MLETPNVPTKGSTLSPAELCRRNEWGVGDRITHDDCTPLVITAIGRKSILVEYPHGEEAEVTWLAHLDWRRVVPDPEPKPHDWAELIAGEIEKVDKNHCLAGWLRGFRHSRHLFNRAVQAIVDRETPNGGAIEWAEGFNARHYAAHRGRVAVVGKFEHLWHWNVSDRTTITGHGSAMSAEDAKVASEAALRAGA